MINSTKNKVLFISRSDAFNIDNIVEFVSKNFDATLIVNDRGDILNRNVQNWSGDYIFCYHHDFVNKNIICSFFYLVVLGVLARSHRKNRREMRRNTSDGELKVNGK